MLLKLIGLLWIGKRWARCVLLVLLILPPVVLSAQTSLVIGDATAALSGPWKFQMGDDLRWAQPNLDDSGWATMDLAPPRGSHDPYIGSSGFVPGWTARGYPGESGFAWYRLRVNLRDPALGGLALKMPQDVDDAYQVYVNGQLVGEFGQFSERGVRSYISQPRAFALPAGIESGPLTIAVRSWMDAHTPLIQRAAGGLHGPPVIGQTQAVMDMQRLDWDVIDRSELSEFLEAMILLLAIVVAFSLYALDRTEVAYLWLGVDCVIILLVVCVRQLASHGTWIAAMPAVFLRDVLLLPAQMALWIFFWACWFRLEARDRLHRAVWALVLLLAVGTALERAPLYGWLLSRHAMIWVSPLVLAVKLLVGAVLLWVIYRGVLKIRTEGLLALPAVALIGVAQYQYELTLFHAPIVFFLSGYTVTATQIATASSLGIVTVLLLRRFLDAQRVREQWRLDIEQARQVQQLLIPERFPSIPGFALESEYRPSQQVGGDFFQIIPGANGSMLAIIGDVSGKGLGAAMLVSLIVGAVRTMVEFTSDPLEILRGINDRLCGRLQNQFATCLALHIAADGTTRIANAGHLPPLWNGQELALAGSIPLGIIEEAVVEEKTLVLGPGDRLILLTDGIVEAQNKQRELFGFVRLGELALEDCSAVAIAAAAQAFGQEDDMTVLRIQRVAGSEEARRIMPIHP